MSIVKNVSRLAQLSARQLTTSSVNSSKLEVHDGYKALKNIQVKYQKHDGLPVHLKRSGDKALMYFTFAGCGVAVVGIVKLIYELS